MKHSHKRKRVSTHDKILQLLKRQSVTTKEYQKLKKLRLKDKFKEKSIKLKDKNFAVDIIRLIKVKGQANRKLPINYSEFIAGRSYEIYIRHKKTKQRRLLAIGKLNDIPINSRQPETRGNFLGGRSFDASLPYPKRAIGKWVPVSRIIAGIQKELATVGKEIKTEVRAAIIPMKRYFHSKWHIYSDKPISGAKKVKKVFVHLAVRFVYPHMDWIGKKSIQLDLEEPTRLDQLHNMTEELQESINLDLELLHPNADDVSLIEVNGYIPFETKKDKKRKNKKINSKKRKK